jgi:hypothetical protein
MARPLIPFAEWPAHVRAILEAVGRVMTTPRLYPEQLAQLSGTHGAILPDHDVRITHLPGRTMSTRKGLYQIVVAGPLYAGQWRFSSGELEKLATDARAAGKH